MLFRKTLQSLSATGNVIDCKVFMKQVFIDANAAIESQKSFFNQ